MAAPLPASSSQVSLPVVTGSRGETFPVQKIIKADLISLLQGRAAGCGGVRASYDEMRRFLQRFVT